MWEYFVEPEHLNFLRLYFRLLIIQVIIYLTIALFSEQIKDLREDVMSTKAACAGEIAHLQNDLQDKSSSWKKSKVNC